MASGAKGRRFESCRAYFLSWPQQKGRRELSPIRCPAALPLTAYLCAGERHPAVMHTADSLSIEDFLRLRDAGHPVIDVRSPSEYRRGHIKAAHSLPLLQDDERAKVGTLYVREGRQQAFLEGLRTVQTRFTAMTQRLISLAATERPLLIYCWRGGMRSNSVAQLARWAGLSAATLRGGYKAYRRHLLEVFEKGPFSLRVLAGFTGSGKTDVLHAMAQQGAQILDLEALARHRGSVFGHLMMPRQPATQQFQNDLFESLRTLDFQKTIWVEDESFRIGSVVLPEPFYRRLRQAPAVLVDVPFEERLQRILASYGKAPLSALRQAASRLERYLPLPIWRQVMTHLRQGRIPDAAALLLHYYDRKYAHGMARRFPHRLPRIDAANKSPEQIARELLTFDA